MVCRTEEPCGVSWLLDLRFLGLVVLMLIALVVVATRMMR
jgi:hypothetical protein